MKENMSQDELKKMRRMSYIKMAAMVGIMVAVIAFSSIAWFTMNREVEGSGVQMRASGLKFELITLSDDENNQNGIYNTPYHQAIHEGETDTYDIWLIDNGSNINNYSNIGVNDETLGIEPGSNGVISFYIKPHENVTLNFTLQTVGFESGTTVELGEQNLTMTPLPSAAGNPACFLNGHILLFENRDSNSSYYSGLIPADSNGKRTFSRDFVVGGNYDADTDDDGVNDAYKVDIYWIWPETLDTLVYNANSSAVLICDRNAAVPQGESKNAYNKVIDNICTYPQYYLSGYSQGTTFTETQLLGRNAMYNDADQEIGMNVEYVLLKLGATSQN